MGRVSVGMLSTWETICGIADFSAHLRDALVAQDVEVGIIPIERDELALLSKAELMESFVESARRLSAYDIAHIQHEFGFFLGSYGMPVSINAFGRLLKQLGRAGTRTIVTFHTAPPFSFAGGRRLQLGLDHLLRLEWRQRVAQQFARPGLIGVPQSRFLRRVLLDSGLSEKSLSVTPHGAPPVRAPRTDQTSAKERLGYSAEARLLVIVGFVSSYKGHLIAAKALKYLDGRYQLAIVGGPHPNGNDDTYDKILAYKARSDKRNRLRITGYVTPEERADYLDAADIVLAPYLDQRLAATGSVLWALASGRPVLASRIPLFQELNLDMPRMLLSTPGAPAELGERIRQLDQDEATKKELVANASAYIRSVSWERVAAMYLSHYRALLERRS